MRVSSKINANRNPYPTFSQRPALGNPPCTRLDDYLESARALEIREKKQPDMVHYSVTGEYARHFRNSLHFSVFRNEIR